MILLFSVLSVEDMKKVQNSVKPSSSSSCVGTNDSSKSLLPAKSIANSISDIDEVKL